MQSEAQNPHASMRVTSPRLVRIPKERTKSEYVSTSDQSRFVKRAKIFEPKKLFFIDLKFKATHLSPNA